MELSLQEQREDSWFCIAAECRTTTKKFTSVRVAAEEGSPRAGGIGLKWGQSQARREDERQAQPGVYGSLSHRER